SIQGEISHSGPGAAPSWNNNAATIACIHVVPHFGGVHTKMSPGRGVNRFHRRLSDTTPRYSRSIGRCTASAPIAGPLVARIVRSASYEESDRRDPATR